MNHERSLRLPVVIANVALVLASVLSLVPVLAVSQLSSSTSSASARAGAVANLAEDKSPLREAFNADPDNVRMILILSPT